MPRFSDYLSDEQDEYGLTQAQRTAALMKLGAYGLDASEIDALVKAAAKAAKRLGASTTAALDWACDQMNHDVRLRGVVAALGTLKALPGARTIQGGSDGQ